MLLDRRTLVPGTTVRYIHCFLTAHYTRVPDCTALPVKILLVKDLVCAGQGMLTIDESFVTNGLIDIPAIPPLYRGDLLGRCTSKLAGFVVHKVILLHPIFYQYYKAHVFTVPAKKFRDSNSKFNITCILSTIPAGFFVQV